MDEAGMEQVWSRYLAGLEHVLHVLHVKVGMQGYKALYYILCTVAMSDNE